MRAAPAAQTDAQPWQPLWRGENLAQLAFWWGILLALCVGGTRLAFLGARWPPWRDGVEGWIGCLVGLLGFGFGLGFQRAFRSGSARGWQLLGAIFAGMSWTAAYASAPEDLGLALVLGSVFSVLTATAVWNAETFEIPDAVSLGGIVVAPLVSYLVPSLHGDAELARALVPADMGVAWTAVVESLIGLVAAAALVVGITAGLRRQLEREVLGLGDVKLFIGAGGFLGAQDFLRVPLLFFCASSVMGLAWMGKYVVLLRLRDRSRGLNKPFTRSIRTARVVSRYLPTGYAHLFAIGTALLL